MAAGALPENLPLTPTGRVIDGGSHLQRGEEIGGNLAKIGGKLVAFGENRWRKSAEFGEKWRPK